MSDHAPARLFPLLLVGLVVVLGLLSIPLFLVPPIDTATELRAGGPVDVVVVLGGDPGRLETAIEAIVDLPEPPPQLAVSVPYDAPLLGCGQLTRLPRVAVRCFVPEPFTTAGEAAWIAATADAEGWDRVLVVTSDYHVSRARILLHRCEDAMGNDVEDLWTGMETPLFDPHIVLAIAGEWAGLVGAPFDDPPACAS